MFGFLSMSLQWVFCASKVPLLNYIWTHGLRCKSFGWYARCLVCVSLLKFSSTTIVLDKLSQSVGYPFLGQLSTCLFTSYTSSYKNFKGGFLKVVIEPLGRKQPFLHE